MDRFEYFDENNYEFCIDSRHGVYIIHGFTNTTCEVKELTEFLGSKGYHSRADNLPGHGTTVDDCNNTKFSDWLHHVETGVAEMSAECETVQVIGISMGGVLALHLASLFPLNGVIAAATVFQFMSEFKIRVINTLFHSLHPIIDKATQYRGKNLKYFGYTHYPTFAVNEMRKLTNFVRPNLNKIKLPALLIHTLKDLTSHFDNFHIVKNEISSTPLEELILQESTHNLFHKGPEQSLVFDRVLTFLDTHSNRIKS